VCSADPEGTLSSCRLYDLTFHDAPTAATDNFARETVAVQVRIILRIAIYAGNIILFEAALAVGGICRSEDFTGNDSFVMIFNIVLWLFTAIRM
jgi:hypothetical protein